MYLKSKADRDRYTAYRREVRRLINECGPGPWSASTRATFRRRKRELIRQFFKGKAKGAGRRSGARRGRKRGAKRR